MKKIGVITSGGDAPGMNAAIRSVVRSAIFNGLEVIGIHRGFRGLLEDQYSHLNLRSVSGIINRGGTVLKTGRCPEMKTAAGMNRAVDTLHRLKIERLVVIGGDGSLAASLKLSKHGFGVICIPGSIDNDIFGTDETIGYDTALNTAVEAIDKIRDTATSNERVFVVEVMGREHGFLSLAVGLAAGAEHILIPEVKVSINALCAELKGEHHRGKTSLIIVFAEGVGNPYVFAQKLTKCTSLEVRVSSLGYIQRGGTPTARSRILASQFGAHAVKLLLRNKTNRLVVVSHGAVSDIPLSIATRNERPIDIAMYKLAQHLAT